MLRKEEHKVKIKYAESDLDVILVKIGKDEYGNDIWAPKNKKEIQKTTKISKKHAKIRTNKAWRR